MKAIRILGLGTLALISGYQSTAAEPCKPPRSVDEFMKRVEAKQGNPTKAPEALTGERILEDIRKTLEKGRPTDKTKELLKSFKKGDLLVAEALVRLQSHEISNLYYADAEEMEAPELLAVRDLFLKRKSELQLSQSSLLVEIKKAELNYQTKRNIAAEAQTKMFEKKKISQSAPTEENMKLFEEAVKASEKAKKDDELASNELDNRRKKLEILEKTNKAETENIEDLERVFLTERRIWSSPLNIEKRKTKPAK